MSDGSTPGSWEVRWFVPGALLALGDHGIERRTDLYWPVGSATVGIKDRQGRREAKLRVHVEPLERFGVGLTGRVERWRKWSPLAALPGPTPTLAVRKARRLTRVDGVAVEVAELQAPDGSPWWTIALETASDDERHREVLRAHLSGTRSASGGPPNLWGVDLAPVAERGEAMGYAEWLLRFTWACGAWEPVGRSA